MIVAGARAEQPVRGKCLIDLARAEELSDNINAEELYDKSEGASAINEKKCLMDAEERAASERRYLMEEQPMRRIV